MRILKIVKGGFYGGVCFECGQKGDDCYCDEDLGSHGFIRKAI